MGGFIKLDKTVKSNGSLIPEEEYNDKKTLYKNWLRTGPAHDWYASLFTFGPEAKEYMEKNKKSLAGYTGEAYTNKVIFDFDNEKNVEKAKEEVAQLIAKLKKLGVNPKESVQVYFSGNKGFHLAVHTEQKFTPEELKSICVNLAKEYSSFDERIYDRLRKFRIANTKHQKSGLYKIELNSAEFKLGIDEIKELAKKPASFKDKKQVTKTKVDFKQFVTLDKKKKKDKSVVVGEVEEVDGVRGLNDIDFSKCPKDRPKCVHSLLQGVMVPGRGERHHILLHLGNYLRNQGYDKEGVYGHLKGIIRQNAKLYPEAEPYTKDRVWQEVIPMVFNGKHNTGGFGVGAEDSHFESYCKSVPYDKPCTLHDNKEEGSSDLVKINEVFDSFNSFATNFENNIVPTGINFIDKYMKICVGTTTLLIGASGSGKSTCALNILENANKQGMNSVFFSLDMHKHLVYLKLAMKLTSYTQDQILNIFKSRDQEKTNFIRDKIKQHYGLTHFDFSGTLSMDDMKHRIHAIEAKENIDIKLVVVDYASRIAGPYSDSYANAKYNALRSKDVSDDTNAAWLILSQISRMTGDGSNPLRTKRAAKDAGDWEEAATNVITMWRPFLSMDGQTTEEGIEFTDDVVKMFLAKNRMGKELEVPLKWDGAKSIICDLTPEEEAFYKSEREGHEKLVQKMKRGF